jgi:hypothetical protein
MSPPSESYRRRRYCVSRITDWKCADKDGRYTSSLASYRQYPLYQVPVLVEFSTSRLRLLHSST